MKKHGLLIVYNAHNLLEFVWYYCSHEEARGMDWDALCLPSGFNGEYMKPFCEKSGLFAHIYDADQAFIDASPAKQVVMFAKMLGSALVGRRKTLCHKMLSSYVSVDRYSEIVVLCDFGLISGMAMSLDQRIVILEDGTADYEIRSNRNILHHLRDPFAWKGFLLSALGYANTAYFYPLRTTRRCIKYSSHPELMQYRNYKEIHKLFDYSLTDMTLYDSILRKLYEGINDYDFSSVDTVLFTTSMSDFVNDPEKYAARVQQYISGTSGNVLIKKHPRDAAVYVFGSGVSSQEINQRIPGEVILPYIQGKRVIFMNLSSLAIYMDPTLYRIECLFFKDLFEQPEKDSSKAKYFSQQWLRDNFKKFGITDLTLTAI